jgi:hypothetical protein
MAIVSIPTKTGIIAAASAGIGVVTGGFATVTPAETALITAVAAAVITAFIDYEDTLVKASVKPAATPTA